MLTEPAQCRILALQKCDNRLYVRSRSATTLSSYGHAMLSHTSLSHLFVYPTSSQNATPNRHITTECRCTSDKHCDLTRHMWLSSKQMKAYNDWTSRNCGWLNMPWNQQCISFKFVQCFILGKCVQRPLLKHADQACRWRAVTLNVSSDTKVPKALGCFLCSPQSKTMKTCTSSRAGIIERLQLFPCLIKQA